MNGAADTVAAQLAHHAKAAAASFALHGAADVRDAIAVARLLRRQVKGAFGAAGQGPCRFARLAGSHRHGSISEVAIFFGNEVELHQISRANRARTGDAVDRFIVDADTHGSGKAVDF